MQTCRQLGIQTVNCKPVRRFRTPRQTDNKTNTLTTKFLKRHKINQLKKKPVTQTPGQVLCQPPRHQDRYLANKPDTQTGPQPTTQTTKQVLCQTTRQLNRSLANHPDTLTGPQPTPPRHQDRSSANHSERSFSQSQKTQTGPQLTTETPRQVLSQLH